MFLNMSPRAICMSLIADVCFADGIRLCCGCPHCLDQADRTEELFRHRQSGGVSCLRPDSRFWKLGISSVDIMCACHCCREKFFSLCSVIIELDLVSSAPAPISAIDTELTKNPPSRLPILAKSASCPPFSGTLWPLMAYWARPLPL